MIERKVDKQHGQRDRRTFLKSIAGGSLGLPFAGLATADAAAATEPATIPMARNYAPPYRLRGDRVFFTNWTYINSGTFSWRDAEGRRWDTDQDKPFGELRFTPADQASGVRLVVEQAGLSEPFLGPRSGWEARGVNLTTVIQESKLFRGWGTAYKDLNTPHVCYYESTDGMVWNRPKLGRVEFEGSRENNIILAEGGNHTVFLDPSAPAAERFKMVIGDRPGVILGSVSPDGIQWTPLPEPICRDSNDTVNMAYFDEDTRTYVLYNRKFYHGRRAIGRSESADFRRFPMPELNLEAGPNLRPTDQLYTNGRTAIPGAPDHHLLFPMIYQMHDDLARTGLLSSYDGRNWHWLATENVLPPPTGDWANGWLLTNPNLVELPDGAFAISYTVVNLPHKYPRAQFKTATGWALWPKGRLAALQARDRGEFTTHPLIPRGRKLRINAVTEPDGQILVSSGAPGRGFDECRALGGDLYNAPVLWRDHDDPGHAEGKEITLSFRLHKAKIYGVSFA